jgi:hypothetical protein
VGLFQFGRQRGQLGLGGECGIGVVGHRIRAVTTVRSFSGSLSRTLRIL